jgi:hypothetical protein
LNRSNPLAPIEDRRVVAVSLDEFGGVRLDMVYPPRLPNDQPYTGSRRIPSVIAGPGADFIAAQMAPMGASRTEKRDIPIG